MDELYLLDKYEDDEDVNPLLLPVSVTIKLLLYKGPNISVFN